MMRDHSADPPASTSTRSVRSERGVVVVIAVAAGMASMAHTVIIPLLGTLPKLLDASPAGVSWAVTGSLLVGAVSSPLIGRLGDLYGKRRVLLAVLCLATAGSLLCAVAGSLPVLIAGRGLQGLDTGIIPVGIGLLKDVLPQRRVGPAIAVTSSVVGGAAALGVPIGATIAQIGDWHLVFWLTGALAAVVCALFAWLVPATGGRARGRFDLVGALGLAAGLTALLLAISFGGEWGWYSAATMGLVLGAAVLLALWYLWERRTPHPLIDLGTATRRPVLLTNIASVLVGFAMYAQIIMVPQLFQLPASTGYGVGLSLIQTGWLMLPAGAAMLGAAPIGARLSSAHGPKLSLMAGIVLIGLGYVACLAWLDSAPGLVVGTVVTNIGVGFAYGAMPALIMGAVSSSETGAANGFNTLMRTIGSSASGAVVGVIFAQLSTYISGAAVPLRSAFVLVAVTGLIGSLVALLIGAAIPTSAPEADDIHQSSTAVIPSKTR